MFLDIYTGGVTVFFFNAWFLRLLLCVCHVGPLGTAGGSLYSFSSTRGMACRPCELILTHLQKFVKPPVLSVFINVLGDIVLVNSKENVCNLRRTFIEHLFCFL